MPQTAELPLTIQETSATFLFSPPQKGQEAKKEIDGIGLGLYIGASLLVGPGSTDNGIAEND